MNKKKRKNQKGFTLIELLAVVVILLAISVMAISSISAAIERNKDKQDNAKKEVLISYGKLYYNDHKNSFNGLSTAVINIDELTEEYNLSEEEFTVPYGEIYTGCIKFHIDYSGVDSDWVYSDNNCEPQHMLLAYVD